MRIAKTEFRIRSASHFMAEDEGADPRDVALKSQHLQIEHQSGVVGKFFGYSNGLVYFRELSRGLLLRHLDSPFNATDRISVLIQLEAIRFSDRPHQPLQVLRNQVENAAVFRQAGGSLGRVRGIADQPLENRA